MRLVRLNYNKIKIFLTIDDLLERGLTKEDIWKDSLKWQQLFDEMLDEANEELGVDIQGTVAIEIFSMQTQGMIMIVTMEEEEEAEEDHSLEDTFIEMNIYENDKVILYYFDDFEDLITVNKYLVNYFIQSSSIYYFDKKYYLALRNYREKYHHAIVAILSEYGNVSMNSEVILKEYGKIIMEDKAIKQMGTYFL